MPQRRLPGRRPLLRGYQSPCGMQAAACVTPSDLPLPFDSKNTLGGDGKIAAGAQCIVTTRPQNDFQPHRLLIGATSVAPHFVIEDIKIGTRSQFAGNGAMAAETFSNTTVGSAIKFELARTSQDVTIIVTNLDAAVAYRFLATMIGRYCY